jgi:hypothetical protein
MDYGAHKMNSQTTRRGAQIMVAAFRASNTRKVALTGIVDGRDIPIVGRAVRPRGKRARNEEREPDGVPMASRGCQAAPARGRCPQDPRGSQRPTVYKFAHQRRLHEQLPRR